MNMHIALSFLMENAHKCTFITEIATSKEIVLFSVKTLSDFR